MQKITVFTDGGSRGNPGPAAAAAVIVAGNTRLICGKYLGTQTNNYAEYTALIIAFERLLAEKKGFEEVEVSIFADSLLVVKQMLGEYRVKNANIKPLFDQIQTLAKKFKKVSYTHVPREKNQEADREVNRILDENRVS
jgi:ribonuclease HI